MSVDATIGSRITDLIGSEYATIPSLSYKDLINAAFNEVADSMKPELLLKYSRTPGRLEGATEWLVEDRKILKVTRVDADSSGIERECKLLSVTDFSQAKDSTSLHYATVYSPIYTFDDKNDGAASLSIFPVCNGNGQEGRIWYFSYALGDTNLTGITTATLNIAQFMPSESMHAIVLKSCINILDAYMSNQIQDEEDAEIVSLLQVQIQKLQQSYGNEMLRFGVKRQEKVGGE